MAIYSKPAKMAVRILTYIARTDENSTHLVRDVAEATEVTEPTVAKILQALAKGGILESRKGPGGGFRLTTPADKVTLEQIVSAIEGGDHLAECVGGFKNCSEENPCPLHERWKEVKDVLEEFFQTTTLRDMAHASAATSGTTISIPSK